VAPRGYRAAASTALLSVIAGTWHCGVLEVCAQDQQPAADGGTGQAGRILRVLVLGEDKQPLIGARLHVAVWAQDPPKGNRDYVTDERGQAAVSLPRHVDILRIWARREGYVPLFAHWWPAMDSDKTPIPDEFTFELLPGTVIGGFVRNEDGDPIEGVKVEVRGSQGDYGLQLLRQPIPDIWLAYDEAAVRSDAEGRWTLTNVLSGDGFNVLLKLTHPEYISDDSWGGLQQDQGVTLESLRERTGTIVMQRGVKLTGTVKDPDGNPVPQAVVIWGDDPYFQEGSQEVVANDGGAYRLPALPGGPLNVTVVARGWAPHRGRVELAADKAELNVQLQRGNPVQIRFEDESAQPVSEVSVSVEEWRGAKSLYTHRHPNVVDLHVPNQADEHGVYEWTWAPDDTVTYSVGKQGYASQTVPLGPGEHVIKLSK
jgi:hypothetical protein